VPDDTRLLKTQKNDVFLVVQKGGLAPTDFYWTEETRWDTSRDGNSDQFRTTVLYHTPTKFYYCFGRYSDQYSPGYEHRINAREHGDDWGYRLTIVGDWLSYLRREYDAPDLWKLLQQQSKLARLATSERLSNDQFTASEKDYIRNQLGEIRRHITSIHKLQLQQSEVLEQGFAHLDENLNSFGKKDWLILAIGTLVTIAVAATFSPDVTRSMFSTFMAAIQPVFQVFMDLIP
jgi:phage-related protein